MNNLTKFSQIAGVVLTIVFTSASSFAQDNGTDNYQIRWGGTDGAKLFGSYSITFFLKPNEPMRLENVRAVLPYKIDLTLPKDAIVTASGNTLDKSKVYVTIYKNGQNCGRTVLVGSGIGANKTCR